MSEVTIRDTGCVAFKFSDGVEFTLRLREGLRLVCKLRADGWRIVDESNDWIAKVGKGDER